MIVAHSIELQKPLTVGVKCSLVLKNPLVIHGCRVAGKYLYAIFPLKRDGHKPEQFQIRIMQMLHLKRIDGSKRYSIFLDILAIKPADICSSGKPFSHTLQLFFFVPHCRYTEGLLKGLQGYCQS